MANTYKNIIITPNTASSTGDPTIQFSGGNTTVNTDITLRVYPEANGTLSFEGSAGQLFSITNDLTGSIFSVNDVSGIPSIDVQANGMVSIAPYGGNVAIDGSLLFVDTVGNEVGIGTTTPLAKLEVVSSSQFATDRSTHFELSTGTGALTDEKLVFGIADGNYSWIQAVKQATAYRNLSLNPSGGNVGIGTTTPTSKLHVNGIIQDSKGDVRDLPINNQTSSYVLTIADTGKVISLTTGNVYVTASVFYPGNTISIFNNSAANLTITQNTSVTMYSAGTANTGNRILQQRGLATIVCVAPNIFVVTGAGMIP